MFVGCADVLVAVETQQFTAAELRLGAALSKKII